MLFEVGKKNMTLSEMFASKAVYLNDNVLVSVCLPITCEQWTICLPQKS